jgi:hypothetical protein
VDLCDEANICKNEEYLCYLSVSSLAFSSDLFESHTLSITTLELDIISPSQQAAISVVK